MSKNSNPFLEELSLMVERLSKRDDYKGSLQISSAPINGGFINMITASENVDLQKKVHVELDSQFAELVSDVQISERRDRVLDSLPEELKHYGKLLYKCSEG
ncbi:hypothetical protein NTH44_003132 [Vibrio metoecus]